MTKKNYTGINIQYPISRLILSGKKVIETRTYPIPKMYLKKEMAFIETPGKEGKFKARAVAIIKFTECFKYKSKKDFYSHSDKHFVTKDSFWAWKGKEKWGWRIKVVRKLKKPMEIKKRKGIIYTKGIRL